MRVCMRVCGGKTERKTVLSHLRCDVLVIRIWSDIRFYCMIYTVQVNIYKYILHFSPWVLKTPWLIVGLLRTLLYFSVSYSLEPLDVCFGLLSCFMLPWPLTDDIFPTLEFRSRMPVMNSTYDILLISSVRKWIFLLVPKKLHRRFQQMRDWK